VELEMVSVDDPPADTGFGLNDADTPEGKHATLSETEELNPFIGDT